MKTNFRWALFGLIGWLVIGAALAGISGTGSHPGEKSNGIGSNRFPSHYAGPSKPVHP